MNLIKDPIPLGDRPFKDYAWPVENSRQFQPSSPPQKTSFVEVFENRRSTRALELAPLDQIVGALLFALAPRYWKEGDSLRRSRRPALSGGALHPISVLLFADSAVFRLNADLFALEKLAFPAQARDAWLQKCKTLLPTAGGTFIALVADLTRPLSAYANVESVVWRDAGAMLQTLALAAELFGLGFCPLGILGSEVVSALPASEQLLAVGAAVLGSPLKSS